MSHQHPFDAVREFHEQYDQPILPPGEPFPSHRQDLRRDLLKEEMREYLQAEEDGDIVEIADALADMIYIICGTALEYGIPLDDVFAEVHRANMDKLDENGEVIYRDDGKVLKPEGWQPPDIQGIVDPS